MRKHINQFCLCSVAMVAVSSGMLGAQEKAAEVQLEPAEEISKYIKSSDITDLIATVDRWSGQLPADQRKLILLELMKHLRSTRETKLVNYADMTVRSRVRSGKMKYFGHGFELEQDVFMENGRCAWAIEKILGCKLPEYSEDVCADEKKLDAIVEQSYYAIVQAMLVPEKKIGKPATRQPEQKGEKKFKPKSNNKLPMTSNSWRPGLLDVRC